MKEKPVIRQQRDKEEKVRVLVNLPLRLKERLLEISKAKNQSMALTIRELLEKALEVCNESCPTTERRSGLPRFSRVELFGLKKAYRKWMRERKGNGGPSET